MAEPKNYLKARTVDVRKRKFMREPETQVSLTPEYPAERRVFRANKFVAMNTTLPIVNQ